jgi:hypothetical protein
MDILLKCPLIRNYLGSNEGNVTVGEILISVCSPCKKEMSCEFSREIINRLREIKNGNEYTLLREY